jgi:hypothetical protein
MTACQATSAAGAPPHGRAEGLTGQAVEQRLTLLQVGADDALGQFEQLERAPVLDAVVDVRPLAPALDQPLLPQRRQLLRRRAGVDPERRL